MGLTPDSQAAAKFAQPVFNRRLGTTFCRQIDFSIGGIQMGVHRTCPVRMRLSSA